MPGLFRFSFLAALCCSTLFGATQWVRVTTPNFDLYTSAGEKAGRDIAQHFEQIRAFFAQASPVKPPGEAPLRIIVFANPEQFAPYNPKPGSGAYFTAGAGHEFIVMRDAGPESATYAIHEYMHFVVRHSGLKLPVWLDEGWSDVYSSMRRVRDGMAVGDLIPVRMKSLEAAQGSWFDLPTLFAVDSRSSVYSEGDRTGLFYGESWALAHMLFLSPEYRENFGRFLMAVHKGTPQAEALRVAFNKTSDQVFADLKTYLSRKRLQGTIFQTAAGTAEAPNPTPASEFEARLMLADLRVATNRSDLARLEYEALEKQQPENKDLQQSMGYMFWGMRDNKSSLEHLEKAFAAGADDPQMCYTLGILQLAAGRPIATILASHERALKRLPNYSDALIQIGLLRSIARDFPKVLEALNAIPAITSDKAPAIFQTLAYASLETGDIPTARAHLATARKYQKSPEGNQALDKLEKLIEGRAKSQYAPKPGERLARTEGMLQGIDCSQPVQKMVIATSQGRLLLTLPAADALEVIHQGPGSLELKCGALPQTKIAVEYAPASTMRQDTAGVLRTLEF